MKKISKFLASMFVVFALITAITSQAQTLVEVNSLPTALEAHDSVVYVSPEDSIYNKAEADYQLFFKMHADPAVSRDTVYSCLMESFANFNKSLEWSTDSVKAIIKERIRSIHPYMQEGGFFYYQARRDREAYPFIKQFLCIPEMPMFSGGSLGCNRGFAMRGVRLGSKILSILSRLGRKSTPGA